MNKKSLITGLGILLLSQPAYTQEHTTDIRNGAQTPAVSRPGENSPVLNRSIVELLSRLDQLQKELRQLRGEMEVANHELSGIKRRQRELYLDVDRRLRDVELAGFRSTTSADIARTPANTTQNHTTKSAGGLNTSKTIPQAPTRDEKDRYHSAFNLLKEGRYDRSIKAFTVFLSTYPNSTYADNAQYWLGEANYVSRKYKAAVTEFGKVISLFPDSTKVPDAMLKLGFTHYELKQWGKAREMLEGVVLNYPKSSAAKLAKTRIKRLERDGH